MALNFPNSPGIGSVFVDTDSGFSYKWDGTVWSGFVGQQPSEIKVLTDISGSFNGILTTFALEHGGSAVHPANSAQLRVVLGGIVQAAGSDYTISTSNIVFTTAPIAALDCAITLLGTALALNVPADESVTPGKLSTGGPQWNTSGDVYISGIATANNGLVVGVGLTLGDNVKLNLGTGSDLQIVHDGSNSIIDDAGTGSLVLKSDTEIKFLKRTGDENILVGTPDGSVAAFYDNTKRFETTTGGALVYGTVGAGQTALVVEGDVSVTGVVTATSFSGNLTGNASGTAGGLTGTPDIAVRNITGVAATFTGNVSVGGTLTYEDVTNVDSVGVITARTGIKVLAGGINAVGVVTATSFSGDGSNLSGVESGIANFVASGAIPNGATVVIKTDGTVGIITSTVSSTLTVTPETSFNVTGTTDYPSAVYDPVNGKIIVAWKGNSNLDPGMAAVGTISGNSISFGTPVEFQSGNVTFISATYVGSGKVVISYRNAGDNNYGNAIVGTVSGTSISFGSAVEFNSGATILISSTYDSANDKVVIIGKRSSQGRAYVGTVSGTSISFGSEVIFAAFDLVSTSATYDSTNGKVVLAYATAAGSNRGRAIVGTVSGTSISFGSEVVFNSGSTEYTSCAYDSTSGKVVIAYRDGGNSNYGTAIVGTVSGTSISFGSEVVFNRGATNITCAAYDPGTERAFIGYVDVPAGSHGYSVLVSTATRTTNLTTENYIGIAAEAISNGATGKISIAGGINSSQTGLSTARKHFVLPDGGGVTVGAIFPVVVAGTSISATKIVVKG